MGTLEQGAVSRGCLRVHAEMLDWCRGRWWVFRVVMLAWFGYMLVRLSINPGYAPVFHGLDLGIHELGHIVWSPLGQFMSVLGGSLTQCLVPIASVLMFYRQRDFFAMAFCLGWFGINLFSVAVYVGDARAQVLPLVTPFAGEPMHDWYYLLSRVGLLELDGAISVLLRVGAALSIVAFLIAGAYQVFLMMTLPRPRSEVERFEDEAIQAIEGREI